MFNVVRAFHVYSVDDVKRCLAEKPAIVDKTNKLSTFTTWKTTAYIVKRIVLPAITLDTLAFERILDIIKINLSSIY
tara:strand:+ start:176 stop:406 length:231 start_codon:yes stop_codon:yes gene_type:complete